MWEKLDQHRNLLPGKGVALSEERRCQIDGLWPVPSNEGRPAGGLERVVESHMKRLRDGGVVGIVAGGSGIHAFDPNSAGIRSSSVSAPGIESQVVRCENPGGGRDLVTGVKITKTTRRVC